MPSLKVRSKSSERAKSEARFASKLPLRGEGWVVSVMGGKVRKGRAVYRQISEIYEGRAPNTESAAARWAFLAAIARSHMPISDLSRSIRASKSPTEAFSSCASSETGFFAGGA